MAVSIICTLINAKLIEDIETAFEMCVVNFIYSAVLSHVITYISNLQLLIIKIICTH